MTVAYSQQMYPRLSRLTSFTLEGRQKELLIEILANIGLTISGFIRGMPKEEKINRNIEILKSTE